MNCPKCGDMTEHTQIHCVVCGIDLTVFRKLYMLSNLYYNKGLEKAKVRDLSGSVFMLKKSLEMNKQNTDARNLLGLVLFEMGETVAALSEWVISKHFKPEENEADHFMEAVSESSVKLDAMNQAIKKYNIALEAAKSGNDDLAILQLKKVINLNPHFFRAIHLLALLYIKYGDYERADRLLIRVEKIDISNTTTLRYRAEISLGRGTLNGKRASLENSLTGKELPDYNRNGIEPITRYREDKPNILAWVNWFFGIAIGIAVTFLLIVPTAKSNIRKEYEQERKDYAAEYNVQVASLSSKDKEIESLKMQLAEKEELLAAAGGQSDSDLYDTLLDTIIAYNAFVEKGEDASEEEVLAMAGQLYEVKTENYGSQKAITFWEDMAGAVYPKAAGIAFEKGRQRFEQGNNDENALELMLSSYHYRPENDMVLYYLGQIYQKLEQYEEASMYYNLLLDLYPASSVRNEVNQKLEEMGM